MAVTSQQIEEINKRIGVADTPLVYDIEKGMIKCFTCAVGDINAKWQSDDNKAVAPPTFPLILGFDRMIQELNMDSTLTILHGSTNLECYRSIVSGDTLTVTSTVTGVREREGEKGKSLFVTFEIKCSNQRQEPVALCRQMAILY
ncbi:MAG: MaoC family dehydratase N-terminal domain-containing protein [Dehalococcoidales bacterium]|nr:MaoC family dehydratase N-terminal domain-containing protein [Dehalococcoidales bacterium]